MASCVSRCAAVELAAVESVVVAGVAMTLASQLDCLRNARTIVAEQAEMESLWCIPNNIVEAHFQQELRRLHAAIEGISSEEMARRILAEQRS